MFVLGGRLLEVDGCWTGERYWSRVMAGGDDGGRQQFLEAAMSGGSYVWEGAMTASGDESIPNC
jgi:hypothetical protein